MAGMASQTRPEPMNASPYHSKVRVSLKFAETQFLAGGMVTGKMELECKAEKGLGLSVIMVELAAIEELTSRDHSATSTFLHTRRLFQGPGLPPSNSVHPYPEPGDPPIPSHYYHARRGITTFFFQLPLPESSPSSIDFGSGLARVRYEVKASVGVFWKSERKLVTDTKQVDVFEKFEHDFNRLDPEGVIVGEGGKIWMQGKVLGGFLVAGQPACIELQVKNHSSKRNTGLSVTLTRELYLPNIPPSQKQPIQLSDTATTVSFKGPEYIIQSGAEGVANLVVDIPKNARGVKGGRRQGDGNNSTEALFEVRCIVGIKLAMGIGSKDIRLDLPVMILHPSVAPDLPPPDMYAMPTGAMSAPLYDPASGLLYQPPMSPAPFLDRPISPYAYPAPPMSPPIAPYVDHGQVWFPHPSMSPPPPNIYHPASHYGHPASQYTSLVAPFVPPPRPSSAEPTPSQPLSGIPTVVPPAPLIPMPTGGHNDGDREAGKGERASRIAHHLRMSSRHRSASPPAHRYHLADPAPAPHATIAFMPVSEALEVQNALSSPASSPQLHTRPNLTLSPLPTGGDVVSPRPMLSPKASFSKDPFEPATQVENLERIAADVDINDVVASSPRLVPAPALSARSVSGDGKDKTLPKPPVPSGKEHASTPRGRADTLFPPELVEARADETPPTPTLAAAVTSLKVPRGLRLGNAASGLDALEARLLAEVGTRKPEKERAPDVRSVMPLPMPIAIPRATDVEPPVDSAISSLTLPGLDLDGDDKTLKRGKFSQGGGSDREAEFEFGGGSTERARGSKETMRGRERESRDTKKAGSSGTKRRGDKDKHSSKHGGNNEADGAGKDKEMQKLRKAAQGRIAAWLGNIDPDVPPDSPTVPPETPPPPPVAPSPRRGRSLARSPPRSPARSPKVSPAPPVSPARKKKSAEMVLKNVPPSSKEGKENKEETEKGDGQANQAVPNPRSSGFLPIGSVRAHPNLTGNGNGAVKMGKKPSPFDDYLVPKAAARLGVYPPPPLDPEVKYDVRSARGGRGGIVTSVAAMWASAGQGVGKTAPTKPTPVKSQATPGKLADQWKTKTALENVKPTAHATPKPATKPKPDALKSPTPAVMSADTRPRMMQPTAKSRRTSPAVTPPAADTCITSVGDLTARRARMIKSSSVPAVVSSSTATPTLSSTASLARPSPARADRAKVNIKLPPTISEGEPRAVIAQPAMANASTSPTKSPGSPPAKNDYAFGQARLRELIKRYQGQVNSS